MVIVRILSGNFVCVCVCVCMRVRVCVHVCGGGGGGGQLGWSDHCTIHIHYISIEATIAIPVKVVTTSDRVPSPCLHSDNRHRHSPADGRSCLHGDSR